MIELLAYSGLVGAFLIICAWAFEAFEAVERHKKVMDLKFAAVYIAAMALMVTYSLRIGDMVFVFLNITTLLIAAFEIAYTIHIKNVHIKKVRRKRNAIRGKR